MNYKTNELQNKTQKTKDRATRTPQKMGANSGAPGRVSSSHKGGVVVAMIAW
jgi:hypothetical protein